MDKISTPPSNEKFRRIFIIQRRSQRYMKNALTRDALLYANRCVKEVICYITIPTLFQESLNKSAVSSSFFFFATSYVAVVVGVAWSGSPLLLRK